MKSIGRIFVTFNDNGNDISSNSNNKNNKNDNDSNNIKENIIIMMNIIMHMK